MKINSIVNTRFAGYESCVGREVTQEYKRKIWKCSLHFLVYILKFHIYWERRSRSGIFKIREFQHQLVTGSLAMYEHYF